MNGPVALPAGTVTFVFSDVEGSTELLKRLGDGYATLIADHRSIVRETFGAHGGVEIDAQGDAFFFAFARARDAATAAVEAQRRHAEHDWPNQERVRVRMGSTRVSPPSARRATSGSTSCVLPAFARPGGEAMFSSRGRRGRCSELRCRRGFPCIRWVSAGSRTSTSPSAFTSW